LRQWGPSPQSFAVLVKCAVPRQNFHIRTHAPEVTLSVCQAFDIAMLNVCKWWAGIDVDPTLVQTKLLTLPCSFGGCGLVLSTPARSAAYAASRYLALKAVSLHTPGPRALSQKDSSKSLHEATVVELRSDPEMCVHLRECVQSGSALWLTASKFPMSSSAFAAALRYRLWAAPMDSVPMVSCGCGRALPARDYPRHAGGCARAPGSNATTKHHSIVSWFVNQARRAGWVCEQEPRGYQTYRCYKCDVAVTEREVRRHDSVCGAKLLRSGVDFRIGHPVKGDVFYDFTSVHVTAPSHIKQPAKAVTDRIADKILRYCGTEAAPGSIAHSRFVVLVMHGLGGMHTGMRQLLGELAVAQRVDVADLMAELSVLYQYQTGDALARAGLCARNTSGGPFLPGVVT
jgi:hypothetical protein